jgi:hypothetical protein
LSDLSVFLWAFGASVALEVISIYKIYLTEPIAWPARYGRKGYYVTRFCVGIVAAGLAVGAGADTKWQAIGIGAAAPLIYEKLSKQDP